MYKIIGADGKAYGPVSEEQVRHWLTQRRIGGQTQAQAEGSQVWQPLSDFPEFTDLLTGPPVPTVAPETAAAMAATTTARVRGPFTMKLSLAIGAALGVVVLLLWLLMRKG